MIEPNLPGLSVGKQCKLLSISGSSFYYEPKGETEMNLVKWSGKTGQPAKMYPTLMTGYSYDQETQFFGQVQSHCSA